jgi:hypothetical protein
LILESLALTLVVFTGFYFCALAAAILLVPAKVSRFLRGFASSPRVHFTELSIRLVVGAALVIYAPLMSASDTFSLFGWVLLITTACLLLLPWRWHHWFAQQAVPRAIPYIKVIGICSLALGGLILAAVIRGNVA